MDKKNILIQKRNEKYRPLILDGAMGSYFQREGFKLDKYLWASLLNIVQPDSVRSIHKQYIDSGADVITTNTFRTNPLAKKKSTLSITNAELVNRSVLLAREAAENSDVIIAGSNAPAEDCYQTERNISLFDLEYNHKKHIEMLLKAGVDIIWNETQSHKDEIEIICKFCNENNIPFVMNIFFNDELNLLSGEPVEEIWEMILYYSPKAIGVNCISQETFKKLSDKKPSVIPDGFYLNCGLTNISDEIITSSISPENYSSFISEFLKQDLLFVGSCCGSSPSHTKELRELVNAVY